MSIVSLALAFVVAVAAASFFRRMFVVTAVIALVVAGIAVYGLTNDLTIGVAAVALPTIAGLLIHTIVDTFRLLRAERAPPLAPRQWHGSRSTRSRGRSRRAARAGARFDNGALKTR